MEPLLAATRSSAALRTLLQEAAALQVSPTACQMPCLMLNCRLEHTTHPLAPPLPLQACGRCCLRLAGVRSAEAYLDGSLPSSGAQVLDALQLVHLDTSGPEALRQLHKVILLRGGTLRIDNVQEQPRQVMAQAGFEEELARRVASEEVAA